jgi:hypothetical protein
MKEPGWKVMAEIVGVSAVVLSLIFVGLELRQGRRIARVEVFSSLVGTNVNINEALNQHADIWLRGAAGEHLSNEDGLIFGNLVVNVNDRMLIEYYTLQYLDDQQAADRVVHDFAARLHQNPGARRVWLDREESLNRYRQALEPDSDLVGFWQEQVAGELDELDELID